MKRSNKSLNYFVERVCKIHNTIVQCRDLLGRLPKRMVLSWLSYSAKQWNMSLCLIWYCSNFSHTTLWKVPKYNNCSSKLLTSFIFEITRTCIACFLQPSKWQVCVDDKFADQANTHCNSINWSLSLSFGKTYCFL